MRHSRTRVEWSSSPIPTTTSSRTPIHARLDCSLSTPSVWHEDSIVAVDLSENILLAYGPWNAAILPQPGTRKLATEPGNLVAPSANGSRHAQVIFKIIAVIIYAMRH
jgi:hypothetical protein